MMGGWKRAGKGGGGEPALVDSESGDERDADAAYLRFRRGVDGANGEEEETEGRGSYRYEDTKSK
jgi:hypothetical protein